MTFTKNGNDKLFFACKELEDDAVHRASKKEVTRKN